jgi:DNA-directed RNA polymerase subunit E'/Rpb7
MTTIAPFRQRTATTAAAMAANEIAPLYIRSMLTTRIVVHMSQISRHVKTLLERELQKKYEGRCIADGFVRPKSINIVSYSAGIVRNENIEFVVVYEADICHPVENLILECVTKTITKAGIHAVVRDDRNDIEPITVFIARDHHYANKYFSKIKENEKINVRVIGVRFELNDTCVYVIAELKHPVGFRGGGTVDGEGDYENRRFEGGDDSDDDEDNDE